MDGPAGVGPEPWSYVDDEIQLMPSVVGKLSRNGVSMASNMTPVVADADEQEVVDDRSSDGQPDAVRNGMRKSPSAVVSRSTNAEPKKTVRWLTGMTSSDWNGRVSV
jgi:hypothetical protein